MEDVQERTAKIAELVYQTLPKRVELLFETLMLCADIANELEVRGAIGEQYDLGDSDTLRDQFNNLARNAMDIERRAKSLVEEMDNGEYDPKRWTDGEEVHGE